MNTILGLHHITAIAGNAKQNLDFYTRVLGQRLVKKTVNFDDPGTYHFYFGDEKGTPGTILTFFPWGNIGKGQIGSGMATNIGYAVPGGSIDFWRSRLIENGITPAQTEEIFGELHLPFADPDGLLIDFIEPLQPDTRKQWLIADTSDENALRGFHTVTLSVRSIGPTATILTDIFGFTLLQQEGNRYRFITNAVNNAAIVDIIEDATMAPGRGSAGTNHHVAFRVKNEEVLMEFREKVAKKGLSITPKIDRDYFFSLYFREPGGVLFEIATDNPGFTKDEPLEHLGMGLQLPGQYEIQRTKIEAVLPNLI